MSARPSEDLLCASEVPREHPTTAPGRQRITVRSPRLSTVQRLHALAIVVVPLAGSIAALYSAWNVRFGVMEVALLAFMYVSTITGITVGFHRHFAHGTFQAVPSVRMALGVLGSMAAQGPLLYWASNHRRHHQLSDRDGDPHSPHRDGDRMLSTWGGLWHAHMGWTFGDEVTDSTVFAKDMLRDPLVGTVNRFYFSWVVMGLLLPFVAGSLVTGTWVGAASGLLWGGFFRLLITYHATNAINSIAHTFGSRPFATREESRNNFLLGFPVLGEGWHNNHHAFPGSAVFGLRWWQLDPGAWMIRVLEGLGLAWDVRRPSTESILRSEMEALSEE